MTTDAHITYTLSNDTGYGVELCKVALERSKNDINAAKRLLGKWHTAPKAKGEMSGIILTYYEKEAVAAVVVDLKCDDEFFVTTKEFRELAQNIAGELVHYDHYYVEESTIERLQKERNCTISVSFARIEKTSPLSLVTTYTHRDKVGVVVETEVANEMAFADKAFRVFSFECALHIAAFNPYSVSKADIPEHIRYSLQKRIEKELLRDGKAMTLWASVIEGKISKWAETNTLLNQTFIKSEKDSVDAVRKQIGTKIGSDITIKRFVRLELG